MVSRFFPSPPLEEPRVRAEGASLSLRVLVGRNRDFTYHLLLQLDPSPDLGGAYDFSFALLEHGQSTHPEHVYFHSDEVARVIDRDSRAFIREALLDALKVLIQHDPKRVIIMRCPPDNLPRKAKLKYYALVHEFMLCDYAVHLLSPCAWRMEHRPHDDSCA